MKFPLNPEPLVGLNDLSRMDEEVAERLLSPHSAASLLDELPRRFSPAAVGADGDARRLWELVGVVYKNQGRAREALAIFWRLYEHMLDAQTNSRVHKGMPLCWIADCFTLLGFPAHANDT